MASYGEGGYGTEKHHGSDDAYGNPVRQTDEYGNPIQHTTGAHGEYGTGGVTGTHQLRRSGSSSSSSSEDDGMGGRRKKSIKEKIKEKLPGGHKQEQQTPVIGGSYGSTGEYGTTATGEQPYDKKGMMDKIKDKLPGGHPQDQHQSYDTSTNTHGTTGGYGTTATAGGYGTTEHPHENKGVMEKIKDKLPGGHKQDQHQTYETSTTTGGGYGTTGEYGTTATGGAHGTTGGYGTTEHPQEKKGLIEKIKDKLPGGHN